jgi:hypothetical protein
MVEFRAAERERGEACRNSLWSTNPILVINNDIKHANIDQVTKIIRYRWHAQDEQESPIRPTRYLVNLLASSAESPCPHLCMA